MSPLELVETDHMHKVAVPEQGMKASCPKSFKGCSLGDGLALRVGGLIVHSLGDVVPDSPFFQSTRHIFPVGYRATRIHWSASRPHHRALWVCQVLAREVEGQDPVLLALRSPQVSHPPTRPERARRRARRGSLTLCSRFPRMRRRPWSRFRP
jgi:hypothetical protein